LAPIDARLHHDIDVDKVRRLLGDEEESLEPEG
jgi:hypothetical protein